ncbi:MAG: Rieske (2Fe-2S) protein [Gemmatimonadetes bacterium]|nr:Rieske (2Fe-2S) protein [Gemmatimonadota bacterium]
MVPVRGGGTLSVPRADVEAGRATLVELPGSAQPILLLPGTEGGWVALHARCTHRGCQPDPVGERLVCPCHGSEFSLEGDVLEGPADRPLRRFPVREDGDRIVITVEGGS